MKTKNIVFLITGALLAGSCVGYGAEMQGDKEKACLINTTQDIYVGTTLAKDNIFSPYLEVDLGYRYDTLNNILELNSSYYDILGSRKQKLQLFQLNVKTGFRFLKYLFLKGNVGFGFGHDKDIESSYLKDTDYLVNSYTKGFSDAYGFEWLFGGGFHIPLYKKYLALDPELGYDYKKIKIPNSLKLRVSAPYVGGTLYFSPGYHVSGSVYGSYFFLPAMEESGYLYLVNSNTFLPVPDVHTHSGITAYKVGATLAYLFYKHYSVSFEWERFSAKGGAVSGVFGPALANIASNATLDYWHSNQFQLGIRYSF